MYGRPATIFYSLSSFVLFTAFFVMQPSRTPEVAAWQQGIRANFNVAWQQTIGDQPVLDNVALIFDSISDFYKQSAESALALARDPGSDRDLAEIYGETYHQMAIIFQKPAQALAEPEPVLTLDHFMTEEPLANIIGVSSPALSLEDPAESGMVSGVSLEPVNLYMPWVTMRDNLTGQFYCVALYNGEVNKYLGTCNHDFH